jgi:phosphate transport system substrate-binding protein
LDNKIQILVAVIVTAIVCIAGTYVLVGDNSNKSLTVTGSTTIEPLMVAFQEEFGQYSNYTLNVSGGGSSVGIANAENGTANIGMSSSEIPAADLAKGLVPLKIGRDAVVIIADNDAGITNLTLEQLAKIYCGEYTNWNQVGGSNLAIKPIIREDGSGTRDCIDKTMAKAGSWFNTDNYENYSTQASTGFMQTQAETVDGAIGYVNLGVIPSLNTGKVTVVTINGVIPSKESVLDNTYVVSRNLWLVTNGQPSGDVQFFFNWILSPLGQKVVEKEGFVAIGTTS